MLTGPIFFFLSLLPGYAVGQLVSASAKCSPGFEWLYTSVNQSPCDVAVELGGVCQAGQFNITQLIPGNAYFGPTVSQADSCLCSSVYYSLLSACAFCQQQTYIQWSDYNTNCSTIYVATFPEPIPLGVKVPTWAYQNVSTENIFDINIANSTNKSEGPPSSTATSSSTSTSSASTGSQTGSSNKIAAIAAAVGALVCIALGGGLIALCRRKRSLRTARKEDPVLTNLNYKPEDTRPTIPGFSAPGTPFAPPGALGLQPYYQVPNVAYTGPPAGYPMSVAGTSDIYETSPLVLPNAGVHNLPNPSAIPMTTGYYDPHPSVSSQPLSTLPVTTDNYWNQTASPSIAHSPATDRYYDSPPLSVVAMQQTGDSRYPQSATTDRQSSVAPSPQTSQTTSLPTDNKIRLLPPAYADIVEGSSTRPPQPEKQ